MTSLARHHAGEGFGGGLKVAGRQPRNPTHGRQDKSADRGLAHVVGKIEEFTNVTNTGCWRSRQIMQAFQQPERHRPCCAAAATR